MRRWLERTYPYAIPLCFGAGFWWLALPFPKGQDILAASLTMGSIFVGFLATAKSILIGFQSPAMEILRKTRFYELFLDYIQEAMTLSLCYCVFTLGGFFYDPDRPPFWYGVFWVTASGITLLLFHRVSRNLFGLVRNAQTT